MKLYAGIGARSTPQNILELMTSISKKLYQNDYILRSGGAQGADSAFECGVLNKINKEIYKANDATIASIKLASRYHNNWSACSPYVKKLHGRNALIILGLNFKSPVNFVICWTPNGSDVGGTGLAIRIAKDHNIPVLNLYDENTRNRAVKYIEALS